MKFKSFSRFYSWDCLQEGHEPASCENWKDWFDKIAEIKPEECKFLEKKNKLIDVFFLYI